MSSVVAATTAAAAAATTRCRFIDIGANLTDSMFRGIYRGKSKHADDFDQVLQRASAAGVERMVVTGTSLSDAQEALALVRNHVWAFTEAVRAAMSDQDNEFDAHADGPQDYLAQLRSLIEANRDKVVAVGETGLDYDRLEFCPKETQKRYFQQQIDLALDLDLPIFLHLRNAHDDFLEIMNGLDRRPTGVVHSYDGPLDVARQLLDLGFYIGINGCSLKTQENLDVVAQLPLDRLMLETDCPWCDVRPTHASAKHVQSWPDVAKKPEKFESGRGVKGRNEPAMMQQVAEVVAGVHGVAVTEVAAHAWDNSTRLFFSFDHDGN
ncbi:uncharacterized protein MONBRDRAFT_26206 [Monosiga brevicollis MX1]|uniref:TatD related DNase n=1 Tax=Monosiga brevicollis TaxID=81824 RepID=A9V1N6_MONBE|nr:uncharacterized protein MONBRDRAFT_26206 [Monosiga brevicollis MX1]EDQ88473.1 predicted protein [Monosiga brevicollis MX1]|eukprot:XP_001746577.1 hypothetical protein [Monosiga brevicollis MX1]